MIDLAQVDDPVLKFLSLEPLHGPIDFSAATVYIPVLDVHFSVLPAFDWVIVGGESGNETGKYRYRICELAWIEKIVADCRINHIPVFVKQMGTYLSKQLEMSDRHGGLLEEFPASLQIREFPHYKIKTIQK
jgi:protein gp37